MKSIYKLIICIAVMLLMVPTVWASEVTIPNSFTSGTKAKAAEVNANFNAVKSAVNDNNQEIEFYYRAANIHVMLCGTSLRDVTTFIPKYPSINMVRGCSPAANTMAMLVTRYGQASVVAGELQAYLNNGGIVIGEFSINDELYNKAFGAAVSPGARLGSCLDHAMPEVQYNPDDALWQAVDFVSDQGCGYNMQAFPGITPLGGWASTTDSVSLAYRDQGSGRLWLLEADWQDTSSVFTAADIQLMKYMLSHRR